MITPTITTTNDYCYQAISSADNHLSWTEKLEGAAWSVGFRLASALVVIVMAPSKLFAAC